MRLMLSRISSKRRTGSLEGTHYLALDGSLDARFESSFFHEIDGGTEKFGDLILNVDDIQKRKRLALVESREEVDVGSRSCVVACGRAEQREANYAGGTDFPFVGL
jgi:hypothetical protein